MKRSFHQINQSSSVSIITPILRIHPFFHHRRCDILSIGSVIKLKKNVCFEKCAVLVYYAASIDNLTFRGTCIVIYFYNKKANEMHNFSNLFDKVLYMFRTGPLSIIRSISTLYTHNRLMSNVNFSLRYTLVSTA